jgi:HPt (histidine-containing phosphotransfer) domain-containing protein
MSADSMPAVDTAALDRLNRIGGQAFLVEMIELFLEHAPQRLATAREAFDAGDLDTVYRTAHSLKSTAANVGAEEVRAAAERLEERAAAGDATGSEPLLEEMVQRYGRARSELERERDRRKGRGTWIRREEHDRDAD